MLLVLRATLCRHFIFSSAQSEWFLCLELMLLRRIKIGRVLMLELSFVQRLSPVELVITHAARVLVLEFGANGGSEICTFWDVWGV